MCGFFAFSTGLSAREIADMFELETVPRSLSDIQSLKFFPKSTIPTISKNSPNTLVMRYWSLVPPWWSKSLAELTFSTFNARAEDIATKVTFRTAWMKSQRCLIPVTWFYEFAAQKVDGKTVKVPHRVEVTDQPIITLAGLYETWESPEHKVVESVTIITTEAIQPLQAVHHRQPVIIPLKEREPWLDKTVSPSEAEHYLHATDTLTVSEIDRRFNKAFGDEVTQELVRPIG